MPQGRHTQLLPAGPENDAGSVRERAERVRVVQVFLLEQPHGLDGGRMWPHIAVDIAQDASGLGHLGR